MPFASAASDRGTSFLIADEGIRAVFSEICSDIFLFLFIKIEYKGTQY